MINEKFWLAIAFFTFLAIIIKYAWPLIAKALDNKAAQIAKDLSDAKEMKELAQILLQKAEKSYQDSLVYAKKLIADAEIESQKFAEESKQFLETEITKKTAAAMERIKMEEESAVREIKEKIIAGAVKNLTDEIKNGENQEQQNNLMQHALKQLEQITN